MIAPGLQSFSNEGRRGSSKCRMSCPYGSDIPPVLPVKAASSGDEAWAGHGDVIDDDAKVRALYQTRYLPYIRIMSVVDLLRSNPYDVQLVAY